MLIVKWFEPPVYRYYEKVRPVELTVNNGQESHGMRTTWKPGRELKCQVSRGRDRKRYGLGLLK